jgi:putative ABC transport system permease protein
MFLVEGFTMGLLSNIIGILVGVGVLLLMNTTSINFTFGQMNVALAPDIPAREILLTTLIVMLVSVFASLQPAYKASRMEPVDALGHV